MEFKLGQIVFVQSKEEEGKEHPVLILGYENEMLYGVQGTTTNFFEQKDLIIFDIKKNALFGITQDTYFNASEITKNHRENCRLIDNQNNSTKNILRQLEFKKFKSFLDKVIASVVLKNRQYSNEINILGKFMDINQQLYSQPLDWWTVNIGALIKIERENFVVFNTCGQYYHCLKFSDIKQQDGKFSDQFQHADCIVVRINYKDICINLSSVYSFKNNEPIYLYDSEWSNQSKPILSENDIQKIQLEICKTRIIKEIEKSPNKHKYFLINNIKHLNVSDWTIEEFNDFIYTALKKKFIKKN